jgi:membrane protease YdiL (CAAX protease family)
MDLSAGDREPVFWTWRDLLVAAGLAVPLFVAAGLLTGIAMHVIPGKPPRAVQLLVPQFVGFAAALVPIAFMFRVRYDRPLWQSVNLQIPREEWHRSFFAGIGLATLVMVIAVLLDPPRIHSPLQELMDDPASAPYLAVAAVTLAPLFEELFFRGLLQPLLVRDLGVIVGIVLSALPFALLHGPEFAWSWRHVLLIAIAGMGFALKRHLSGSLGAAMVTHSAYNAVITTGHLLGRNLIDG